MFAEHLSANLQIKYLAEEDLPTLTLGEVESSFSSSCGKAKGAKWDDAEIQERSLAFKSCAVIRYGSSGGGRNVIGK